MTCAGLCQSNRSVAQAFFFLFDFQRQCYKFSYRALYQAMCLIVSENTSELLQTNSRDNYIRADDGREYCNGKMYDLACRGIIMKIYHHEKYGVIHARVERKGGKRQ